MTNYQKGANKEREVKKLLEDKFYTAIRSAGSHGPVDVVAWDKTGILLIQVKYNCLISKDEKEILENMPIPDNATIEVWEYVSGNKTPKITKINNKYWRI
jgi:hypothetical protein